MILDGLARQTHMAILVTGAAGFIGSHVTQALLARGDEVIGIDNINAYYEVTLKQARLAGLLEHRRFTFSRTDVGDRGAIFDLIRAKPNITCIIHLAAQAGVRYSLVDPYSYVQSNLMGHVVMLEAARALPRLEHFVYASSSSVYGRNQKRPFAESDPVEHPISLYAASKRADELITESYSWLYQLPATGLRFFTVYGPWGRPDMAYYLFATAIMSKRPIRLFAFGKTRRDFTYIDDIVAGVISAANRPPPVATGAAPHRIYNLGNNIPESLGTLVSVIEQEFGREAEKIFEPLPPGDVEETFADIESARRDLAYDPKTSLREGLPRFVRWFKEFHALS
jgi:UDP-glucuronate 4-epimerase